MRHRGGAAVMSRSLAHINDVQKLAAVSRAFG